MPISQRSARPWGGVLLTAAVTLAAALAHADPKPPEMRTMAPAVPLSSEQQHAIAMKGVPPPLRVEPVLRPLKSWQPKGPAGQAMHGVGAAVTPMKISPGTAATPVPISGSHLMPGASALPPGKMPARAPAPYAPRPGQLDPFSLKPDEIAVVGGQKIPIPHAAVIPAATRKTP